MFINEAVEILEKKGYKVFKVKHGYELVKTNFTVTVKESEIVDYVKGLK